MGTYADGLRIKLNEIINNSDSIINFNNNIADLRDFQKKTELEEMFKNAYNTKYTEFTYSNEILNSIDIWDNSNKENKLFTKTIIYDEDNISSISITDEILSKTLIKTFTYLNNSIQTKTEIYN